MKFFKTIRGPFIPLFLAILILFVSCSQYDSDTIERKFEYSLYKNFKEKGISITKLNFNNLDNKTTLQDGIDLLTTLNNQYGSNLTIPDHILNAMVTKTDIEDVKSFVINEGLLSNEDVNDLIEFVNETETDDFQLAIDNFEQDIISRNLSEIDFEKYDQIASSLKIMKDENPAFFSNETRGLFSCLAAYVVWLAALIGFVAGCATIFLCVAAGIGLSAATIDVVMECGEYMEEQQ